MHRNLFFFSILLFSCCISCLQLYQSPKMTDQYLISQFHNWYSTLPKGKWKSPNIEHYTGSGYKNPAHMQAMDSLTTEELKYTAKALHLDQHPSLVMLPSRVTTKQMPEILSARDGSWKVKIVRFGAYSFEPLYENDDAIVIRYGHTNYGGPDFQQSYTHYCVFNKSNGNIIGQTRYYGNADVVEVVLGDNLFLFERHKQLLRTIHLRPNRSS